VPALGRLVWALAAFALHCDRPAALVSLSRAAMRVPYDDDITPVMTLIALRHPTHSGKTLAWRSRTTTTGLRPSTCFSVYPVLRGELDAAMLEADLVLAMCTARFRSHVFSRGHVREAVQRLTARVGDATQRRGLQELFPGEIDLEARLERAYALTGGP
jgi:hypothetical protein